MNALATPLLTALALMAVGCIPPNQNELDAVAAWVGRNDDGELVAAACFPAVKSFAGAWDAWLDVNGEPAAWHSAVGAVDSPECVGDGGWLDLNPTPEVRAARVIEGDGGDVDIEVHGPWAAPRTASYAGLSMAGLPRDALPATVRRGETFTVPLPANAMSASVFAQDVGWLHGSGRDENDEVTWERATRLVFTVGDDAPLGEQHLKLNGSITVSAQACEGFDSCWPGVVHFVGQDAVMTVAE